MSPLRRMSRLNAEMQTSWSCCCGFSLLSLCSFASICYRCFCKNRRQTALWEMGERPRWFAGLESNFLDQSVTQAFFPDFLQE